ncbi:FadD3 family acyl-CoA ligase [Nocardia stercoris]|uniref:Fatty acid--CoA ligase n=1 Tax=Nocardia stercoris TaxID=2483361 RepID=A0A3M2KRJ5_9NOCA|nr:FadD3 family acyl-CoA ligase [Nocardia stercoris]RMI28277.1 fatty acid--CoA ligase [Nocardia stercoris]
MADTAETIPLALRHAAAVRGAQPAVQDGETHLSWAHLLEQVRTVAAGLTASGVRPGDRVAIWAPNSWRWVVALLGLHYAGATLVPLNTRYIAEEAADLIRRVDAKALFITEPFLGRDLLADLRATDPDLKVPVVVRVPVDGGTDAGTAADTALSWDDLLAAGVDTSGADAIADAVTPDDVSDIMFTSGTTGRSKGCVVTHGQAVDVARAWAECATLGPDDRYLVIPPFFHNFGYKAAMVACLVTGACIVPQSNFDIPEVMRIIAKRKITVLTGPPTIYQSILDHSDRATADLSSLRVAVTGAATVPEILIERMRSDLAFDVVLTAYGLSESAGFGTMCRLGDDSHTIATTSGRPIAGFELRIGEDGEVLLRGPNVMKGYLDDPEQTAKTIDAEGWLHTGDVGTVDDNGNLRITDRLKDMYISGGFNVYPAEIEKALRRLDGVADVAVIGIPDTRMGEVGKAFIVRQPGSGLTATDVFTHAHRSMAKFKVPRDVEFRDSLPYNAGGKVLKHQLREEKS